MRRLTRIPKLTRSLPHSTLTILLFAFPSFVFAQNPSEEEQFFFDSVNRERVEHQLRPLQWDNKLVDAARQHAALMADQAEISHQFSGEPPLAQRAADAGARFSQVGENVAMGRQAPAIHTGWMHSPGHRANILDPHFTALGVGVAIDDGQLYAVEDFSAAVANMNIEAQEEKVAALLAAQGLRVSSDREKARQRCSDQLAPLGHVPMLIWSFEAADLSELPEPLQRKITQSKYRQAAVGACQPKESAGGMARFRITVLLFATQPKT
jgi:hypothetical protein